ncbi:uncharacterized protein LOC117651497 [Thrips palmi]|uniref:Uncharacterized protein LOC117651497 n=1 Tax=Thrips palmi TaxID=161013 RepID=A0A6P9A2B7_THRPL|nr:uncharacterized protein LOC117651497 [Thrips palmi]XP_034251425.1 uncharacterized protein LOC117651497 [Thrips palmi]
MDISTKNRSDPKRRAMKKRLSLWDSFFSKVQNEFVNSTANNSEIDLSCLQDPKLLSVEDEHNNLRRSLRVEHGINEESEISESEAEWQINENGDNATDCDNMSGEALDESESEIQKTSNTQPNHKKFQTGIFKKPTDKNIVSPGMKKIEVMRTISTKLNHKADAKKNKTKEKMNQDHTTENFLQPKIRRGKVVEELQNSPENYEKRPKAHDLSTQIISNHEKELSQAQTFRVPVENSRAKQPSVALIRLPEATSQSKTCRTDHELHESNSNNIDGLDVDGHSRRDPSQSSMFSPQNTISDEVMTEDQRKRKRALLEMCKQYDLWKLHKERKSGRRGSIYILSDLNEEISDANRIVPALPSPVKNPIQIPRRFTLKKCNPRKKFST